MTLEPRRQDVQATIDAWVEHHQRAVLRYLRYLGCPPELAEDLAQDAFLAALERGVDRLPPAASRGWLRTTARNLWRMHLRRDGRRRECAFHEELDATWTEVLGDGDGDDYLVALAGCMDAIDARGRKALALRYGEGASRAAMATELELGEPGVKALLRRIRTQLRTCIENKLGQHGDGR